MHRKYRRFSKSMFSSWLGSDGVTEGLRVSMSVKEFVFLSRSSYPLLILVHRSRSFHHLDLGRDAGLADATLLPCAKSWVQVRIKMVYIYHLYHWTFAITKHYFTGQRKPPKSASYQAPHRGHLCEDDLDFGLLDGSKAQQSKFF